MRPQSLSKVAAMTAAGDSFDRCLANFTDGFHPLPRAAALEEEPVLLAVVHHAHGFAPGHSIARKPAILPGAESIR